MKTRNDRWPSAWAMQLSTDSGPVVVRVTNVSQSGLRFVGPTPPTIGEPVQFSAMGQVVRARVVRREKTGGALAFDSMISAAQLSNLRQYRDLPLSAVGGRPIA
ncbi:PilZ domain-containing protein [Tropicibacter oceani]|uniref:PilZ domain-containing protein n=1 Tax=Tropicibacter oceani TaxID=3058420 RepID=A0ABY8QJN6_9RHOB|nr:PilZ domain-containing protein [Tropicibacter oceani]WGW04837.1 PilZ domain-containing protein [Tropicibacter oceani]